MAKVKPLVRWIGDSERSPIRRRDLLGASAEGASGIVVASAMLNIKGPASGISAWTVDATILVSKNAMTGRTQVRILQQPAADDRGAG
jgi:hypothetical protein